MPSKRASGSTLSIMCCRAAGRPRSPRLLRELTLHATENGVKLPFTANTPYINTIPADEQALMPGSPDLERRIKSLVRWNAAAMVVRANKADEGIGGHISTFASAATLYEVGFNHFFRGHDSPDGDIIFFQGHAAPGIYARAFLEGRIDETHLENFRRELKPGGGLSSYPHPWLMPDFWEYPTVSMGLGPIMAIYQARFMRYLEDRGLKPKSDAKVWAFLGDGETDEPEALGAITLPAREKLDNLIFVINCNLQRLDGPVRGNGQIIQELEAAFRGAGWNVIKVIWGREWDPLLAKDRDGLLVKRMGEIVDGQYQKYAVESGAYVREHFWGVDPRLLDMVKHLSDDQLKKMTLGGHDPIKVYNAYKAAVEHKGAPTVILARTIKGYGLGEAGEGKNITHQQKKMNEEELRAFRTRFGIPISDAEISQTPFYRPAEDSVEIEVPAGAPRGARRLRADPQDPQRAARAGLAGALRGVPHGHRRPQGVDDDGVRAAAVEAAARQGARPARRADRARRSAHVRHGGAVPAGRHLLARRPGVRAGRHGHAPVLQGSVRRPDSRGRHHRGRIDVVVHRRRHGLRHARRQHDSVLHLLLDVRLPADRRSDLGRRRLARRAASCSAAPPAARRSPAKGCSTRTATATCSRTPCPNVVAYDPAFAYEIAVIIQDGIRRMYIDQESIFYYLTVMNEQYAMPAMPDGAHEGILKGLYRFRATSKPKAPRARAAVRQRRDPARSRSRRRRSSSRSTTSAPTCGASPATASCTATATPASAGTCCIPARRRACRTSHECLKDAPGVLVAASDYVKALPDSIDRWLPRPLDGARHRRLRPQREPRRACASSSRSTTATSSSRRSPRWRATARSRRSVVQQAIKTHDINPEKTNPAIS